MANSYSYFPSRTPWNSFKEIPMQVIYPDTQQQMATKGWTDDDLLQVMDIVTLSHIIAREGGWDSQADWKVGVPLLWSIY